MTTTRGAPAGPAATLPRRTPPGLRWLARWLARWAARVGTARRALAPRWQEGRRRSLGLGTLPHLGCSAFVERSDGQVLLGWVAYATAQTRPIQAELLVCGRRVLAVELRATRDDVASALGAASTREFRLPVGELHLKTPGAVLAATMLAPTMLAPTMLAPTMLAPTMPAPSALAPTALPTTALPTTALPTTALPTTALPLAELRFSGTPHPLRLTEEETRALLVAATEPERRAILALHDGIELTPLHQLEPEEGPHGLRWRATGVDPHFGLQLSEPLAGWYRVELRLVSDLQRSIAKLYRDTGAGFHEAEADALCCEPRTTVDHFLSVDSPIHALRLDPTEAPGSFTVEWLRFVPISEAEARRGIGEQLSRHHPAYAHLGTQAVLDLLEQQARAAGTSAAAMLQRTYTELRRADRFTLGYEAWIDGVESRSLPSRRAVAEHLTRLAARPLISVLLPVFEPPEAHLRAAIDSVLVQSYPHWELCIVDDASRDPGVRRVLDEFARRDARIRVVYREMNGHISQASNDALGLAQGDFVALLDHDDCLAEHALHFMACAIDSNPRAQLLYSDEDKLDSSGRRCDPHFKSDWNPDLFFSGNYVSHLGVYPRELLARIGGFRRGVEGSQDYDLVLRCLPHLRDGEIVHVPRVLYHWRAVPGSTALAATEKSYTTLAGAKALRDYFASTGQAVGVEPGRVPNTYRVRHRVPTPAPLVTLLIPTRDRVHLLEPCVRSILRQTRYEPYELVIIDNGSTAPATHRFFNQVCSEDLRVRVLSCPRPFNFSALNNFGARHARGSILGLVNNDVEVIGAEWLEEMVSHACRPEIGCVGAKLYYPSDTVQHGGVLLGIGGVAGHSHPDFPRAHPGYFGRLMVTQNVSAVTAACLLVRKVVYEQVGGLDEEHLPVAFNDVDFCLKVRAAGYRNVWTPYAELYHHESASRGTDEAPENAARFRAEIATMLERWGEALRDDPYYNPNLNKGRGDFSLAPRAHGG